MVSPAYADFLVSAAVIPITDLKTVVTRDLSLEWSIGGSASLDISLRFCLHEYGMVWKTPFFNLCPGVILFNPTDGVCLTYDLDSIFLGRAPDQIVGEPRVQGFAIRRSYPRPVAFVYSVGVMVSGDDVSITPSMLHVLEMESEREVPFPGIRTLIPRIPDLD